MIRSLIGERWVLTHRVETTIPESKYARELMDSSVLDGFVGSPSPLAC
jgi:hypothetical protein